MSGREAEVSTNSWQPTGGLAYQGSLLASRPKPRPPCYERHHQSGGGVFEPISQDRATFSAVRVNEETGMVEWSGEVDLDPEVLYGRFEPASGARLARRVLREPGSAGA